MMKKIWLDTDIGSDIDDSLCLAYLLRQANADLLGISTVGGEARKRGMVADSICALAQKEIPVYLGAEEPLLIPQKQDICQQAEWLDRYAHRENFPEKPAVQAMAEAIFANPHEVALLAIGPLTNIALLFAVYPQAARFLKQLVIMGTRIGNGAANLPVCEWNVLCDPAAAEMVYHAPVENHVTIGLDVTHDVTLTPNEIRSMFRSPEWQPILDYYAKWLTERGQMTFHDPITAAYVFDQSLLRFQRGHITVELQSEALAGYTYFKPDANGPHRLAASIDKEAFFAHFAGVCKNA